MFPSRMENGLSQVVPAARPVLYFIYTLVVVVVVVVVVVNCSVFVLSNPERGFLV